MPINVSNRETDMLTRKPRARSQRACIRKYGVKLSPAAKKPLSREAFDEMWEP